MTTTLTAVPYPNTQTVRTNLCANPSFETGTAGWTTGGTGSPTLARVQGDAVAGAYHARLTTTVAGGMRLSGATTFPWTPGWVVTVAVWVRGTAGRVFRPQIWWSGSSSVTQGSPVVLTGSWQRAVVTATAPAAITAFGVDLLVDAAGGAVGQVLDVDAVLIEGAATAGDYLDGSLPSGPGVLYAWTGAAHASTSTRTVRVPTTAAWSVTPIMAMNRQDEREGVVTVHRILGTDRTVVTVATRPAALRTGTLELLCANLGAADVAAAVLRAGTVMVVDTDDPSLGMYAVAARVRTTPGAQGTGRAVVSCDYYEVGIEGDAW